MANDELLDSWEAGRGQWERKQDDEEGSGRTLRPDPIHMLFDGPPPPLIVREGEELPLQRPPSARLALNVLVWFFGSLGLLVLAYRLWWEFHL